MTRTTIRLGTAGDAHDDVLDYSRLRVIMGSTERRGAWPVPRHLDVNILLGSVELDLRHAQLAPGITTIEIDVTLGSALLIIPEDMPVEIGMQATAASVDETTGFTPNSERPVLRIVGDATLASCEIRRAA